MNVWTSSDNVKRNFIFATVRALRVNTTQHLVLKTFLMVCLYPKISTPSSKHSLELNIELFYFYLLTAITSLLPEKLWLHKHDAIIDQFKEDCQEKATTKESKHYSWKWRFLFFFLIIWWELDLLFIFICFKFSFFVISRLYDLWSRCTPVKKQRQSFL